MNDLVESIFEYALPETFVAKPNYSNDGDDDVLCIMFKYKIKGNTVGKFLTRDIYKDMPYDGTFETIAKHLKTTTYKVDLDIIPFNCDFFKPSKSADCNNCYCTSSGLWLEKGKLHIYNGIRGNYIILQVPANICIEAFENAHQLILDFLKPK